MTRQFCLALCCVLTVISANGFAQVVEVGQGSFLKSQPADAKSPPKTIYATSDVKAKMPTNDWWSSVAWMPFSERQYPHPLAVQAQAEGLRIYYPGQNITANKDAIFGFMPTGGADLILGLSNVDRFADARVAGWDDWFVRVQFGSQEKGLRVTYGHGSPFVYARFSGGSPQISFAKAPKIWSGEKDSAVLGVTVDGRHYGIFAPAGSKWTGLEGKTFSCDTTKDYCSIACLPKDQPDTLKLFAQFAHAHVTNSQVSYSYQPENSTVETIYTVTTESLEGETEGTLLALYPHQWKHTSNPLQEFEYNSVRGKMKVVAGTAFKTTHRFPGVLPTLPNVEGCDPAEIAKLLRREADQPLPGIKDTYWDGKWLGKTSTLIPIAEQYGETESAAKLRQKLRERLEAWLTATTQNGSAKRTQLFWYDDNWGTLIGHPASFGSDVDLNDHHFHYGYFFRAAAEIVRTDPKWADDWGGMLELLMRDVASPSRTDPQFPFMRNFDLYAGHSWASGHAKFGDGNNNESSSEAMNAWYGMILWGEFTGNVKIRDLGIYLYTTEMNAIQEYWFDVDDTNHPETYTPSVVTMIWGGKGANGTWFTANPESVHGINWLPIHGGSLYLGHDPAYVEKNYAALKEENKNQPWDAWADIVWMYRALSDADDAMKQYAAGSSLPKEEGNSLANTYHWIGSLQKLGHVQPEVTANTTLFAIFEKEKQRTYVVYGDAGTTVTFSDGFELPIKKTGLHTAVREIPPR